MTEAEEGVPLSEDSHRQAAELDSVWQIAPAAANGAAMLALLNLVGNVDDPDAAVVALRWVFLLTGLGLVAGLAGLLSARRQRFHEHRLWKVMQGLDAAAGEIVEMGQEVRATTPDRARLRTMLDVASERVASLRVGMNTHYDRALRERRYAELCRQASILLLTAAFMTGWAGHLMGRRLQPPPPPIAAQPAQPVVAPSNEPAARPTGRAAD